MNDRVLDTCTLSTYLRPNAATSTPNLFQRVSNLIAANEASVAAVTVYEMRRGLLRLALSGGSRRGLAQLTLVLQTIPILSLDVSGWAGWNLAAQLHAAGQLQKPAVNFTEGDLLITATAAANGKQLLTTDARLGAALTTIGCGHFVEVIPVA